VRRRAALVLGLVIAVGACRRAEKPRGVAAANPTPAPSIAPAPADAGPRLYDLLQTTSSEVAVSSNVDNPRDFPEHLLDGKPETAWNGKTNDLNGWIAFKVPPTTQVKQILVTAGFDKKSAQGDLFTMNHRIRKVRVTREGEAIGEFTLDIEKRELQPIPIDRPGGSYRIEVLATEPGTKTAWKELCVSELRVVGIPGKLDLNPFGPHVPDVRVGALGGVKLDKDTRAAVRALLASPSPDAFCAAHVAHWKPINDAHTGYPGPLPTECTPKPSLMKGAPVAPFQDAILLERDEDEAHLVSVAFQTATGWHMNGVTLFEDSRADPHCSWYGELYDPSVTFHATDAGGVALVQWHVGDDNHVVMADPDTGQLVQNIHSVVTFRAAICRVTGAGLVCDKAQEVEEHAEAKPLEGFKAWRSSVQLGVNKDGTLRRSK
jgi:hypothetical protein